ncbi:hypothetical protein V8E53_006051 [Lactarius tabidus]
MEHNSLTCPSFAFTSPSMPGSPSLSNVGAMIARAVTPTQPFSQNSGMPPVFVVFICTGVFVISLISRIVWRRRRQLSQEAFHWQSAPAYILATRGRNTISDTVNGRPEMFDTWAERCTSKSLKWEEYMPFTVRFLTKAQTQSTTEPVRKAGRLWGDDEREKAEGEGQEQEQEQGGCHLQVGVLVAMPSQCQTKKCEGAGLESLGRPLRDGLAIGLAEMPWIEEDRLSHKKTESELLIT